MKRKHIPTLQKSCLGVLSGLSFAGCAVIPTRHIHTEITIAAQTATVWNILCDNARYPEWNPYHVRVDGKLEPGRPLVVEIHKPNRDEITIRPKVMRLNPQREIVWGGGIRGVFFGERVFRLESGARDSTRLIHEETFSGVAVPYASLEAIEEGYHSMNTALKIRAENWPLHRPQEPREERPISQACEKGR